MRNPLAIHAPILLALLFLIPGCLGAQASPDSIHRRNNCRLAAQIIQTGTPRPQTTWAWQYIGYCNPATQMASFRSAIQQARTSTDLVLIERAILSAATFQDEELFELTLEIAGDRTATVPARVMAFVALATIRDPSRHHVYEWFIRNLDENDMPQGGCSMRSMHPFRHIDGPRPLPADFDSRIEQLRNRVLGDMSEPRQVRSAASCT